MKDYIYEACLNGNIYKDEFIYDFTEKVIAEEELEWYLKKIVTHELDEGDNTVMYYSIGTKSISISNDLSALDDIICSFISKDDKNYLLLKRLYLVMILTHELRHVIQYKNYCENKDTYEDILYGAEFKLDRTYRETIGVMYASGDLTSNDYVQKLMDFTDDFSYMSFTEKDANTFAADILCNVETKLYKSKIDLKGFFSSIRDIFYKENYDYEKMPLLVLFSKYGKLNYLCELPQYSKNFELFIDRMISELPLIDRIKYNFPLTKEEFTYLNIESSNARN